MIKVGLIGAGFIGRNHFNQYEQLGGQAGVVALCDKEPERRAGNWSGVGGNVGDTQGTQRDLGDIRQYADWQELIAAPEVELVDICVPTHLHAEISIAALRAGKHVLCEKPMALNPEQCDAMLAAAEAAAGKFMIAQCIRFWPEYVYLKKVYDDGRFGRLKALQLRRQASEPDYALDNWILNPELSGGAILDLHVHDVDYALHLLGKPETVRAQAYPRPSGAVDRVHALWHCGPDLVVQLEGFWDMPPGYGFNCGITAVFEQGALDWDLRTGKPLMVYRHGDDPETPEMPAHDGYYTEIAYFLGCIERNEKPTVSTPAESRTAVAIALAEQQSAMTGEPVRV